MNDVLIWHCSPRANGSTDTLAEWFAQGASEAGANVATLRLRDYAIAPCEGCNACAAPPNACALDGPRDDAAFLFARLASAKLHVFAAPVYFYALPAHFKAWIDRGQRFWNLRASGSVLPKKCQTPALAIMAAGRPRGRLLFEGGTRTLRWFLKLFDIRLHETLSFRGINDAADLHKSGGYEEALLAAGKNWQKFTAQGDSNG